METIFTTIDLISNEETNKRSANPWELAQYKHQVIDTDTFELLEAYKDHTYYLTGEIPLDLTIDKTGLITGKIKLLNEQVNKIIDCYPNEPIKKDGSNWTHNGRPKEAKVDFKFQVNKKTIYKDLKILHILFLRHVNYLVNPLIAPIPEPEIEILENEVLTLIDVAMLNPDVPLTYTESEITILENFFIKDPVLEKFYYKTYENFTEVTIRVIKNNDLENLIFVKNYMDHGYGLNIGSETFYKRDFNRFLNEHPGPFGLK